MSAATKIIIERVSNPNPHPIGIPGKYLHAGDYFNIKIHTGNTYDTGWKTKKITYTVSVDYSFSVLCIVPYR